MRKNWVLNLMVVLGLASGGAAQAAGATSADQKILEEYVRIQQALASDTVTGVSDAAGKIVTLAKGKPAIRSAAVALTKAATLEKAREGFKKLSEPVVGWAKGAKPVGYEVLTCSMAGASWVQKSGDVRNPYYGKEMLSCGEKAS